MVLLITIYLAFMICFSATQGCLLTIYGFSPNLSYSIQSQNAKNKVFSLVLQGLNP